MADEHLQSACAAQDIAPGKGSATGSIIGGILGVIILLAIIATVVVMVCKRQRKNIDAPPTHKPPPPMKSFSYADRPTISEPISNSQNMYETHREKPETNVSVYYDEGDRHETSQHSAAYSWEQKEALFPDHDDRERDGRMEEERYFSVNRGSSFVSSAVVV
ncbi:hypothetical protein IRJ41_005526 [Triplophysa rosa]|uniref:Uncharacterized protein n=1 Tax=Triplophysa rosa TaxID=992332 RepID=A0A9W8C2X6_TRIRA|nr:hypothetical protein IRJ41_005526 [Triplophysa rosa]